MNNPKRVIVTGITGQMGSYFTDFLLEQRFTVIGTVRRLSVQNHRNIEHCKTNPNFILAPMDLGDSHSINALVEQYKPDYFINCAANSFVGSSWDYPEQHIDYNMLGVLRQLDAIKQFSPTTRYINFGSSEEFGDVVYSPQDEKHPPRARSPYGVSKIGARQIIKVYRESFNLFALQCWCFNYESPRRGEEFVTRKITKGVARIAKAIKECRSFEPIELGNLDAKRDWSDARDFVKGIWMMLNQEKPNEYVLASGETHSIREFVELAFKEAGIPGEWIETRFSQQERYVTNYCLDGGRYPGTGVYKFLVKINPAFYRPADVQTLCGDSSRARAELGWSPQITFSQLVRDMVRNDLQDVGITLS